MAIDSITPLGLGRVLVQIGAVARFFRQVMSWRKSDFTRIKFQKAYNYRLTTAISPERKGMAKRVILLALAIILASYVCLGVLPNGLSIESVKFYLDPGKIEDVGMVPNTTFNVSVKLDNVPSVPGLVGVEFNVTWDPLILKGVSLQEVIFNQVTPVDEVGNIWKLKNTVANNSVSYAYTFQDIGAAVDAGYAPISGNHTVANITLKVVGTGKTSLNFTTHKLGDPLGGAIAHDVLNATFSNVGAPPAPQPALISLDPSHISNGSLGAGATFALNVKIVNASDVAGLEFKLGFNASALNAQSVAQGVFIPLSVTPIVSIDNASGFVKFNVSLSTPLNGDGTLTVVQFQVMADGVKNSTLHLYDVVLVDSGGQTLTFTTADGSFTNLKIAPGDLNHDGIVDIYDTIDFSNTFGSSPANLRWNPEADLNGDGQIDIFDLILMAMRFGTKA